MIAKLSGLVDTLELDTLIIDVHGVGYLVHASSRTLGRLAQGQSVSLLIEPIVSQEQTRLFGFLTTDERQWFRLLLTVQGVGGKVALALLAALSPEELAQAIGTQDTTMICRADGVGPKLGGRIVAELKDKVPAFSYQPVLSTNVSMGNQEALLALINLGYKRAEVAQVLQSLDTDNASVETVIRMALQRLSGGGLAHG